MNTTENTQPLNNEGERENNGGENGENEEAVDGEEEEGEEMENEEETEEEEGGEGQRISAMVLLNHLSTMIGNASIRLSDRSQGESSNDSITTTTTYDKTLAAKHEYLGTDLEEVRGRTLHDEGSIVWLPILMELEVVLVPGQTLPLTAFYPPTISMFRKIIAKDRTFGVVFVSSLVAYGTTAEIFQYQEDNDLTGFKIKAKGRQRFRLLEEKRQTPGILSGKVLILPEISLVSPMHCGRFVSLDKYRTNPSMRSKISFYDSILNYWPSWVYKQFDKYCLVERVTKEIKNLKTDVCSSALPTDPVDLSYWVAQCLPIDGLNRMRMLSFNTATERLQYALTLMAKDQKFYCSQCGNYLADRKDVFSMSIDGPQGMYCNPGGYVHEIITVYKGSGMTLVNEAPNADYSWFPGYGWTIAQCSNCNCHMGWLFTAMKENLKPAKFWGLSRRSASTHSTDELDS